MQNDKLQKLTEPTEGFWKKAFWVIRKIDGFTAFTGHLVMLFLIPLIFSGVIEVVMRYWFNSPTSWSADMTFIANGSLFMLGAAYALLQGAHVRTDIFWDKFSPRTRGWIDLTTYTLLFVPTMLFVMVISYEAAVKAYMIGERSNLGLWQPIIWPVRAVIPLSSLLLLIQGVSEALKAAWAIKAGQEFSRHEKIEV